jgi:hypothetical protein
VREQLIALGLDESILKNKDVRAWLEDRYIKGRTKEIHPIEEAAVTLNEYVEIKDTLLNKIKTDDGLKRELENRGFIEDRLKDPLTLSIDNMIEILNQYRYGGQTTVKTVGVEIKPEEFIGKVGEWNIWLPKTQETSAKIAGYDEKTKDPRTTWCTARTKGSNLFYHYISRKNLILFLFYIIKDNPSENNDWLSVGFSGNKDEGLDSIEPIFDSKNGGITVNRANVGLDESSFEQILGSSWSEILNKIKSKILELGGINPATKELELYANNLPLFKKEFWNKSNEERKDFCALIIDLNPSDDVLGFIAPYLVRENPRKFIIDYLDKEWANPYLYTAAKAFAKKEPANFLYDYSNAYFDKEWAKPHIDAAARVYAEEDPDDFINYESREEWAKPYIGIAAKNLFERDPERLFLWSGINDLLRPYGHQLFVDKLKILKDKKYEESTRKEIDLFVKNFANKHFKEFLAILSEEPLAEPYISMAAENMVELEPFSFLEIYPDSSWAKPYVDLAAKGLVNQEPFYFLEYFMNKKWSEPYIKSALDKLKKQELEFLLFTFFESEERKEDGPVTPMESLGGMTVYQYGKNLLLSKFSSDDLYRKKLLKLSKAFSLIGLTKEAAYILNLK